MEGLRKEYMVTKNEEVEVKNLIKNDALFNNILVVQEEFDILPKKEHIGASITYKDLKSCDIGFLEELYDSIVEWIYSLDKYNEIKETIKQERGKSDIAIASEIQRVAINKFRKSEDKLLIQGQMGELLLFHFIERFFKAQPLLRKMPITTSPNHERFGADAIHYKKHANKNIIYLGESKCYTSKYKFKEAFEEGLNSILESFYNLDDELSLYMYEDFLDKKMQNIAQKYKNNTLEELEIHLVCLIVYNENISISGDNEQQIKENIINVIRNRAQEFDKTKINIKDNPILNRINYIIFPVWKLDKLAEDFSRMLYSRR